MENNHPAKVISQDIIDLGKQFGVEPACIAAVKDVETSGSDKLPDGRLRILFEGHVFWHRLIHKNINPNDYAKDPKYADVLYPNYDHTMYKGGAAEYDRLELAKSIDEQTALECCSWGLFQIMGYNYSMCTFTNVYAFIDYLNLGQRNEIECFLNFIKNDDLLDKLKAHDWVGFALHYNGSKQASNHYSDKLQLAYESYQA